MVFEVIALTFTYISISSFFSATPSQTELLFKPIPDEQVIKSENKSLPQSLITQSGLLLLQSPTPTPTVTEIPSPTPIVTTLNEQASIQKESTPTPTQVATPTPTEKPQPIQSETTPAPTLVATPTLEPAVTPISAGELDAVFSRLSSEYSVDGELLKRIAKCESSFNVNAQNGDYKGMFQFATETWRSVRSNMGFDSNPDLRSNAEESIRTAAAMIAKGQQNAWKNCL